MFKRKSVLYTWCLSYGLLLLMMVVMCIMLGRNARNQLISEYKSITQTLQKQSNNAINDYFDELERCAYEISNDYLVNDFVSTPDPSGSKYYNLQPIQQSLSVYALQSGGEVSRYLYMDNIGRALSSDAIFRLHEFYASLGLEAAMSAGDFTTLLQDYHYNELYVFETGGKSEALMLTSVPLVGGTPKGTLVQVMNPETIAGMIQSNSAVEDSTTVLLDSDGSLLSATGDAAVAELLENADVSSAEDSEITLGGQLYWIQRERLPKAGWHLITVVPMSSIGAKSDWIIRRALPVMLAMVCMTAVLCLCFLYIQYKPLNRLRQELAGTAGHALSGNEYDQLLAAFTDAKSSRDQIQMLWENQRNELRQEFVQSCIEGDVVYDEKHLHQVLERLDAGFSGDWFGVVLLDAGGGAETLLDSGSEREALEDLLNHMAQGVRAYVLSRKGYMLKKPLTMFILFTMYFSGGIVPFYLWIQELGFIDTRWAILVPLALNTYNMIVMRTAFASVPESLIEAAKLDGASDITCLFRIIIPLSKATVAVILLFYAVARWNEWLPAAMFLRSRELFPLQIFLREILLTSSAESMVNTGGDASSMLALSEMIKYATIVVSTLPILVVYPFVQKYFVSGVMVGGVKE